MARKKPVRTPMSDLMRVVSLMDRAVRKLSPGDKKKAFEILSVLSREEQPTLFDKVPDPSAEKLP